MKETIRVLVLNPGQRYPKALELPAPCDYHALQALVGGLLDAVSFDSNLSILVNDEGLLDGMPANVVTEKSANSLGGGLLLVGTLVWSRVDDEGETISTTDADEAAVRAWLDKPDVKRPIVRWQA